MTTLIYTTPNCPGCKQLKAKWTSEGKEYLEVVIGSDISREAFFEKYPGVRTVPYVVEQEDTFED
jgi:glutaredoxin